MSNPLLDRIAHLINELKRNYKDTKAPLLTRKKKKIGSNGSSAQKNTVQNYGRLFCLITVICCIAVVIRLSLYVDGYIRVLVLNILGLTAFIMGLYGQALILRVIAYVLWIYTSIALVIILFVPFLYPYNSLIFNSINAACGITSIVFLIAAYRAHIQKQQLSLYEIYMPTILQVSALGSIFYWFHTIVWTTPYYIMGLQLYALATLAGGIYCNNYTMRIFAYVCYGLSLIYYSAWYVTGIALVPGNMVILNTVFMTVIVILAIAQYMLITHKKKNHSQEYRYVSSSIYLLLSVLLYAWGAVMIILHFDKMQSGSSFFFQRLVDYATGNIVFVRTKMTNVLLMAYSCAYALVLLGISFINKQQLFFYGGCGLLLFGLYRAVLIFLLT